MALADNTQEPEISRRNPTCFLFLVDQSGSMGEPWGKDATRTKAQGVADAVNRLIFELIDRCSRGMEIWDYYHLGMIGYGGDGEDPDYIGLGFPVPALAGSVLCPVSAIAENPLRIEKRTRKVSDGAGGLVDQAIDFPVWLKPVALGRTPMCQAFQIACQVISEFIQSHPACYPPVVFNITDGMATDGDPEPWASHLQGIASSGRNVLVMNIHISKQCSNPIILPNSETGLPNEYARQLFRMSSVLPSKMIERARIEELLVADDARGFAFNADLASVIRLLDIGTRARPGAG